MEVVEDESIAMSSIAPTKLYGKPRHRMEHQRSKVPASLMMNISRNGSNLSVETHPSSSSGGNKNPFSGLPKPSSSDTRDSRNDDFPVAEDSDAMMTSDEPNSGNNTPPIDANDNQNSNGFFIPQPGNRTSAVASSIQGALRVITGDSRATSNSTSGSAFPEAKVSLAPRFGRLDCSNGGREDESLEDAEVSEQDRHLQEVDLNNASLFNLSGSMSSEFLDIQNHHPDHQQEYQIHPSRSAVGMNSPTSTTARDFLREIQCPPMPTHNDEMDGRTSRASNHNGAGYPLHHLSLPLHYRSSTPTSQSTNQRPPVHRASGAATTPSSANRAPSHSSTPPPPPPIIPSLTHTKVPHPTLLREHTPLASSPSPTNDNCSTGRDKPVISRCFAWSQDSQDDRRITKRARTIQEGSSCHGVASSASSPLSTDTIGVMSPSSALETIQGTMDHHAAVEDPSRQVLPIRQSSPATSSPPTKVHWEEKVEHSNELMSHAVDPQVLFGVSTTPLRQNYNASSNEDVAMGGDDSEHQPNAEFIHDNMPPPIATANSASQYSFESL